LACFFELKDKLFKNEEAIMYRSHNILFGLGKGFCKNYHHRKKSSISTQSSSKSSYDHSEGSFSNFSSNEDNFSFNSLHEKKLKIFENPELSKGGSSSSSSLRGYIATGFDTGYYLNGYQNYFSLFNFNNNNFMPIKNFQI
jgi:hypothetical protein